MFTFLLSLWNKIVESFTEFKWWLNLCSIDWYLVSIFNFWSIDYSKIRLLAVKKFKKSPQHQINYRMRMIAIWKINLHISTNLTINILTLCNLFFFFFCFCCQSFKINCKRRKKNEEILKMEMSVEQASAQNIF